MFALCSKYYHYRIVAWKFMYIKMKGFVIVMNIFHFDMHKKSIKIKTIKQLSNTNGRRSSIFDISPVAFFHKFLYKMCWNGHNIKLFKNSKRRALCPRYRLPMSQIWKESAIQFLRYGHRRTDTVTDKHTHGRNSADPIVPYGVYRPRGD